MRLTVDPRDGVVRLTLGTRAALRPALAWAAEKRGWVEAELARMPQPRPILPGMAFKLGDDDVQIDWLETRRRTPMLSAAVGYHLVQEEGTSVWHPPQDAHVRLLVGGPRDQLGARVLRFLRAHAAKVLAEETRTLAAVHNITVGRIGVGDPKSRWGSCAASGDIRYSWRLILAPSFVRQSTVAHEVAHRVHMNHGRAFHRLAAEMTEGDPAAARRWLRAHGPALHWFGRDG
jgi:predicted metal-dependent hydrolase